MFDKINDQGIWASMIFVVIAAIIVSVIRGHRSGNYDAFKMIIVSVAALLSLLFGMLLLASLFSSLFP